MPCASSTDAVRGWAGSTTGSSICERPSAILRRRSGRTFASRWMVATTYAPGAWGGGTRSRAIGAKRSVASAITSPTTSICPAAPSSRSVAADRSSGQRSSVASPSTSIRARSSGIDRSPLRRPASTCASATPAATAARAPASVEFVSPRTSTTSGVSAASTAAIGGVSRSTSAVRRSSRCAGSSSESSSMKTCDSSSSQCCPVWTTTSSIPASRSATESGAALTNCGRLPTTVSTRTAPE